MNIAGLQKLTLLDYPEHTAATIFTKGCNFRCPYCYNVDLVVPSTSQAAETSTDSSTGEFTQEKIMKFLNTRTGLLDGICITGGEPTLQNDLPDFCRQVHEAGFKVKLDTNGTNPSMISRMIDEELIDYLAMDIKNSPPKYIETISLPGNPLSENLVEAVQESMTILAESSLPFEFRTTTIAELHTEEDLTEIAKLIASLPFSEHSRFDGWHLQSFDERMTDFVGGELARSYHAIEDNKLHDMQELLQSILPSTHIRGR